MKVILIKWNSYGNENMEKVMISRGYDIISCPFDAKKTGAELEQEKNNLSDCLLNNSDADYVFSFNYSPIVSTACNEKGIKYISWVYDSPFMNIYSFTVPNPVNRIFVFDYALYQEFERAGIDTVFYLPLGVSKDYLDKMCGSTEDIFPATNDNSLVATGRSKYAADISFVGSLYTEPKHRLYEKFSAISPYAKGYLDAIVEAQKHIYGEFILEGLLTEQIIEQMQQVYPCDPNPTTVMTPKQIYSQFVLARQVTSIERAEILRSLGAMDGRDNIVRNLFTSDETAKIPGWINKGQADYYEQMPLIFRDSKINLNITLRSIKTGIPLRVFDILGAGGFCITNYQAELLEYFTPGEDLVIYEDYDDLMNKTEYYLSHDSERRQIAENGCRKVRNEHNFMNRLDSMEAVL